MAFEIFCVELPKGGDELERLNQFLATHQVISKQQQLLTRDGIPYMMFCLEYVTRSKETATMFHQNTEKPDVWNSLDSEERNMYNRLRDLRNQIAEQEHIKPFVVFTNEQLGEMVKGRITTQEGLKGIKDVGKARMAKYAQAILPLLNEMFAEKQNSPSNENAQNLTMKMAF